MNLTSPGTTSPVAVCFGWDTESRAEDTAAYAHWTSPQAMTHTSLETSRVGHSLIPGTTYYFRARADLFSLYICRANHLRYGLVKNYGIRPVYSWFSDSGGCHDISGTFAR